MTLRWGFDSVPQVEWLEHGGDEVRLLAPLTYRSVDGRLFTVEAGKVTDLASQPTLLPGFLAWLLGDKLASASAAILHDDLYGTHEVTRRDADALFAEALTWLRLQRRIESPRWRRPLRAARDRVAVATFWTGVRVGGWWAWRS